MARWGVPTVALFSLGLAVLFQWPVWSHWGDIRPAEDAYQFAERWEAARVALADFHQFPSWNPYHCGGVALFGDPEAPFPGPLFLLTFFWVPTGAAMQLWMLLHLAAGALGMALLARDMGANLMEQLFAAAVISGCTFMAHHFVWEHLSFAPFLLLPWILWAFRRSLRDVRWSVAVGGLFALAVYEGGAVPVPLMAVVVAIDAVARLGDPDERRAMTHVLPLAVGLGVLLGAPRLLAELDVLRGGRGGFHEQDGMSLLDVVSSWLTGSGAGHLYGEDEYSAGVGFVAVTLMLAGVAGAVVMRDQVSRARRIDAVLLGALTWLAMGTTPLVPLYSGLHALPVFRDLRVPSRFLFPAVVALALVAVHGAIQLRARFGTRALLAVQSLVLLVCVSELAIRDWNILQSSRPALAESPIGIQAASAKIVVADTRDRLPQPQNPVLGHGSMSCYHPQYAASPAPGLRIGETDQQWIVPPQAGSVRSVQWTPNEVRFAAELRQSASVVVNQNYDRNWHSSEGATRSVDGLLAIDLPAGPHSIVVRHRPFAFAAGGGLMACGLALALWVLARRRVA